MSAALPSISVIIPTHQARPVLQRTLTALAEQTLAPDTYEVIVVGGVETAAICRLVPGELRYALRVFSEPGPGAARRRNRGAAEARGELLVFLDDDMIAEPGLLAAHRRAHQDQAAWTPAAHGNSVIMGYLPPQLAVTAGDKPFGWLEMDLRSWWEDVFHAMVLPEHRFAYTDLFSGNFSITASLFRAVGGFDSEFLCHEDYELGARLLLHGAHFSLSRDARTFHYDETDLGRSLQRKAAEGRADIQLARKHPDLGCTLPFAGQITQLTLPSRLLRWLDERWPALARMLVWFLSYMLLGSERLKLRTLWVRLRAGLYAHYYWHGVLAEAHGWREIRTLAGLPPDVPADCVDLGYGIDAAVSHLERHYWCGVRILWNGLPLGYLPTYPGSEALRGRHLRAWVRSRGASIYARALALSAALGSDTPTVLRQATEGSVLTQIVPVHFTRGVLSISPSLWADHLLPSAVDQVNLNDGLPGLAPLLGTRDRRQVLVLCGAQPLGWLHLPPQVSPRTIADLFLLLLAQLDPALILTKGGAGRELQPAPAAADVSVIVCTRNRPENLAGCLAALLGQTLPPREIIVVDNAPSDDRTLQLAAHLGVRYVREDRPGLDFARNCGMHEAAGSIVAYIDDDARAAPNWLEMLAQTFGEHPVAAVTGPVAPAELATTQQCLFESVYGGMSHGFRRRLFRRDLLNEAQLLWASACGVGTNMAFRRQVLLDLHGFDPALDVGGPAGGGGDVEMYHRLLAAGYSLLYEPAVLVWHYHRRDFAELRRQLFNNGRSFGAYLLTCISNRSVGRGQILLFALLDWLYPWLLMRLRRPGWLPRSLVWAELQGALVSPIAYWRAVQRIKNMQP